MINVKQFREDNKLSQKEIAELLGIKQPYLSAIEGGKRPLSEDKFKLLHNHYGDIILEYKRPDVIIEVRPKQEKDKKLYPQSDATISKAEEARAEYTPGPESLINSQARLIKIQEQLMLNNTKLVETNSKLTEQMIELFNKQDKIESRAILESVKKEIEILKNEIKNAPARGDAECADVG